MFNSDLSANRPAAGIVGRIFIAIDSPYGIFRDTGTAWDQISSAGGGAASTIYTANGTLTGNRVVSSGGFNLTFSPQTTFSSSLTAATGGSSYSVLGSNALSFAAGFSSSNIGNVYSANGAINLQSFAGSATFAQANLASGMVSVNSVDFTAAGSTITMTQATGIRAMTGHQSQFQYQGTNSGTITHAAVSQNLGFYRPPAATGTLTITNAYGHLINALDDYGAGFTFTNRWGIYLAGTSDANYFAGVTTIANNAVIEKNFNGATSLQLKNTTAGTGSAAQFQVFSDAAGAFTFGRFSSTTTGFAWLLSNDSFIYQNEQNIIIACDSSSKVIKFGSTKLGAAPMTLTASGRLLIGTTTEISSATMVVTSSTLGFLPPRMTTAQKNSIASPIAGLIV
jgi:hypothetical protein